MGRRTQAERDAITVETGYALASGTFVALATFVGVALPALLLELPDTGERVLLRTAAALGALVFAVRVVHVLRRFTHGAAERDLRSGRKKPDSHSGKAS